MVDPATKPDIPAKPWAAPYEDVARDLDTNIHSGLTDDEARRRLEQYGPNALETRSRTSAWAILYAQFKNLIVLLLAAAAALSFAFGQWLEGFSICIALAINVVIGFVTELKAVRSMESLQELSKTTARVLRGGVTKEISAADVVPGDIVVLESGDLMAADMRIVEASRLRANESALTGESMPVHKHADPVETDAPLAERFGMLYKGTALTLGSGRAIAVATGMDTEIGRISELAEQAESEQPPLEKRLDSLGNRLFWIVLVIAAVIAGVGYFARMDPLLIIETAIALAVAAIPEGLPIVATIALARGMWRMAKRNALINRLSAVETLGTVTVLFSDKTGTLTENRMRLTTLSVAGREDIASIKADNDGVFRPDAEALENTVRQAVLVGVLCNNASLGDGEGEVTGDPMEVALLEAGRDAGIRRPELLQSMEEHKEEAFDPELKMMATFHTREDGQGLVVAVKGAPESVLERVASVLGPDGPRALAEDDRDAWRNRNNELAAGGLRVLALAIRNVDSVDADPYEDMTLVGLAGLMDPPRDDVRHAVRELQEDGIDIIMVTGDQPETARTVAVSLGLIPEDAGPEYLMRSQDLKSPDELSDQERERVLKAEIFSRVSPEQKLDLVGAYQKRGRITAMTGDGVNDAPALRKADIGIAMGRRGTQVAKEAADVVLKDDALSTIAMAVKQGRIIFENIRKFIIYLLSGNIGGIAIVATAILAQAPLPLLPLQILYLNMIHDIFPALALGMGGSGDADKIRKPRGAEEPIVRRDHWAAIFVYGLLIAAAVLTAFFVSLRSMQVDDTTAATIAFLTLAFARTWHVFNMRDTGSRFFVNGVTQNPYIWGAIVIVLTMLSAAIFLPGLSTALHTVVPTLAQWQLILGCSLIPFVVVQMWKVGKKQTRSA
ncbi:cation-translocating P-type ATPase [Oceanidesulfovibrio marinus]|uniref:Cation-transporting P-type ATPase n=1 Tax=Oceanidesulfovibrio marinus TaxID=370038 RepID=A0ABX6ND16_9BACT|nr:cation-transporting P-type ATPase [Oceanidesulfovibrio marinus]QJT08493.1 cation-transporting P-type ATPase [Oceanidesulfovibrio marinus]